MVTRVIQTLHQIQYRIPGFFTLALWILMFIAFIIGNSPFGYALLSFLLAKIIVQLSFWAILIKKMNRLMEADGNKKAMDRIRTEIKSFIQHTKIVIDESDFRQRLAERCQVDEEAEQLISSHQRQILGDLGNKKGAETIAFEDILIEKNNSVCYKNLQIGDYVKVKEGVSDPDFPEFYLTNYQGRILDFISLQTQSEPLILIEWDSVSLRNIPKQHIQLCLEEGFDYTQMQLGLDEVIRTSPRDTPKDVEKAKRDLWHKVEKDI